MTHDEEPTPQPVWEASDEFWHSTATNKLPDYDPTTKKHFWIVGVAFSWQPGTTVLDHENEVAISPPGCCHCHIFYTTEHYEQPCPGPQKP